MRPDNAKGRAAPGRPAPSLTSAAAKQAEVMPTVPSGSGAAGELAAWGAAVEHLHAAGLPAAVPAFPAAWLRRRGVRPDWTAAA